MRYIIRMTTTTGTWYWTGHEPNQYDQWKANLAEGQHYHRRHLAERKASQLREAIGRLWLVVELCVIEAVTP